MSNSQAVIAVLVSVMAGLDPAIHRFSKNANAKLDGCPDQVPA
jgi:hypothetical protein